MVQTLRGVIYGISEKTTNIKNGSFVASIFQIDIADLL